MTVCIAAICGRGSVIFGAADRMITAGDTEFEPNTSKIYSPTSAIRIMSAGDSGLQSEVYQNVLSEVAARVDKEPENWWNIKDVVDLYFKYYNSAKSSRAEAVVLAPLGLTRDTFIERQKTMSEGFITSITGKMLTVQMPFISTIITGLDTTGAHIYVFYNDHEKAHVVCCDKVGFASIGVGRRHAESQLMLAGHTSEKLATDTFLLVYMAKRRAEVAPGVGRGTDMFSLGAGLGICWDIDQYIVETLSKPFEQIAAKEREMLKVSQEALGKAIEEARKVQPTGQKESGITSEVNAKEASPDEEAL